MRVGQQKTLHMSGMHFFVQRMTGEVYLLDVDSSDTLEVVRQKLEYRTGIATGKGRLRFAGKFLEDDRTLADDNIQAQSTIRGILP